MKLNSRFLFLILFMISMTAMSFTRQQAYIDNVEDDDQPISVYKTPGQNWKYCNKEFDPKTKKEKCSDAVGWPGRDADIKIVGPKVKAVARDPVTDEKFTEEYTEIEFTYSRMGADGKMNDQHGRAILKAIISRRKKPRVSTVQKNLKPSTAHPKNQLRVKLKK